VYSLEEVEADACGLGGLQSVQDVAANRGTITSSATYAFSMVFLGRRKSGKDFLQRMNPGKFWFRVEAGCCEQVMGAQSRHFSDVRAHLQQVSGKPHGQSEGELMARSLSEI